MVSMQVQQVATATFDDAAHGNSLPGEEVSAAAGVVKVTFGVKITHQNYS